MICMLSKEILKKYAESECEEISGTRDLNHLNNEELIDVVIRLIMKAANEQLDIAKISNIVHDQLRKQSRYSDY